MQQMCIGINQHVETIHGDSMIVQQQDPELLTRIASGDQAAMRDLLKNYTGLVWSIVRRKVNSATDAEDLVQEIFAEIWKSASRYDPQMGSPATFIAVITRRRVIDHIRKVGRRSPHVSLDSSPTLAAEQGVSATSDLSEQSGAVLKAISTLRPERQTVLDLSIIQGLSHTQITEATGMPLGTVKAHLRRGLDEVRRILTTQLSAESPKEVSP